MTRPVRALAAVVAAATIGVACGGVRAQSAPSAIEAGDVPFGLLEGESATDVPVAPRPSEVVIVYVLGPAGLLPVEREVAPDPGPRQVLRVLVAGPTAEESALGVQSALDPDVAPPEVRREGRLLVVNLHEGFFSEGSAEIAALAQIVYTLTEREPQARVQFLLDGEAVEVPRGDGVLTGDPVTRRDYVAVAAPPAESAT